MATPALQTRKDLFCRFRWSHTSISLPEKNPPGRLSLWNTTGDFLPESFDLLRCYSRSRRTDNLRALWRFFGFTVCSCFFTGLRWSLSPNMSDIWRKWDRWRNRGVGRVVLRLPFFVVSLFVTGVVLVLAFLQGGGTARRQLYLWIKSLRDMCLRFWCHVLNSRWFFTVNIRNVHPGGILTFGVSIIRLTIFPFWSTVRIVKVKMTVVENALSCCEQFDSPWCEQ